MKQCGVFVENKEITIKDDKKSQLYILTRFLEKSNSFIKELVDKYKVDDKGSIEIKIIVEKIVLANTEVNIKEIEALSIIKSIFSCSGALLTLESFFKNIEKKYTFEIKVMDFLDVTLKAIINVYHFYENNIANCFDSHDIKKDEYLNFKAFKQALLAILGGNDRIWNMSDFFM